jgi:hypothetical protein
LTEVEAMSAAYASYRATLLLRMLGLTH